MAVQSVSASLIVRNEGHHLAACLASIVNSVEEIVIVDTGSTDDTLDVAGRFGARILSFPWCDDFASARNFALEACCSDWVLYIDADERLTKKASGPLRDLIDSRWLGADILLQPKVNYTRFRLTRLFRRDQRLRFRGSIHETILPAIEEAGEVLGVEQRIGLTEVEIDHLGYEGDLSYKHSRNYPLLLRCVAEQPQRAFYWFQLAETLLGLGRPEEAYHAGRKAIEVARKWDQPKNLVDAAMTCQMLAVSMLDRGLDCLDLIDLGLRFHSDNYGLILTRGRRELLLGDPASGLGIAEALRAIDPDAINPGLVAYDRDIFGVHALKLQIACLAKLRRLQEAATLAAQNANLLA